MSMKQIRYQKSLLKIFRNRNSTRAAALATFVVFIGSICCGFGDQIDAVQDESRPLDVYGKMVERNTIANSSLYHRSSESEQQPDALVSEIQAAALTYLKHLYTIYFGIKSCAEMEVERKDSSYKPIVGLEQARAMLHAIDDAANKASLPTSKLWLETAPKAIVTADALKKSDHPEKVVEYCQRMGRIFQVDAANIQVLLSKLGVKSNIIPKDF